MPTNPDEDLQQEEEQQDEQTDEAEGGDGLAMRMLDARFNGLIQLQCPNNMLAQQANEQHGVE